MIRVEDASIGTVWVTCLLAVGLYFIRSRLLSDQFAGFPSVNSRKPWEVLNVFAHRRFQQNGPEYLKAGFAKVRPIQTVHIMAQTGTKGHHSRPSLALSPTWAQNLWCPGPSSKISRMKNS